MNTTDQLSQVRDALEKRRGGLVKVAADTGIPYDTVLRIKNEPHSTPAYTTVLALAKYFAQEQAVVASTEQAA